MTFAELREHLDRLTPEQLTHEVTWAGDERGGAVKMFWIAEEDWFDVTEEGAEPVSSIRKWAASPDYSAEEIAEIEEQLRGKPDIPKGMPQLLVD